MAAKPTARSQALAAAVLLALAAAVCAYYYVMDRRIKEGFAEQPAVGGVTVMAGKSQPIPITDLDVYLINLDRNQDRLGAFITQYTACDLRNVQFKRLAAVEGAKVDNIDALLTPKAWDEIQEVEKTGYRTKHYQLTRGAVGCYLSHLKVYELIAKGQKPYGLIFEDDVTIDKHIHKKLNSIITSLPDRWDILLLSCYCIRCDKRSDAYYDTGKFFWLHCYIVKKAAAERLVAALDTTKKRISQQIDSELSDMIGLGQLRVLCLRESLCKQGNQFETTIQTPLKVVAGVDPFTAVAAQ